MTHSEPGSQTLSRGLIVLTMIGESGEPPTVADIAERLGIHRSMIYRLTRTLEGHGFIVRTPGARFAIGPRVLALARNVSSDLRSVAVACLREVADDLEMTAFLVVYDGEAAVTILSAEPRRAGAPVGQRPGTRHPIGRGAPGRVIRSMIDSASYPPRRYEVTRDEVFDGLSAVAVPLRLPGQEPMSIAALFLTGRVVDVDDIGVRLEHAGARIAAELGVTRQDSENGVAMPWSASSNPAATESSSNEPSWNG